MDRKKVFSKLDKVKELSAPPAILNEILGLLNRSDISYEELSDIILKDPSLTVRLLKIANSSFYGFPKEITTINQAVMVMGMNAVKYFILSIAVFNQFTAQKHKSKLNQKQLWTHFLEVAAASKQIAKHLNYELPEEAYVAGLLHDLGLILLESCFPDEYMQVVELTANGKHICQAEREVFGTDHQEIAKIITDRWNMPDKLSEPMSNHHFENDETIDKYSDLVKMVGLAENIAQGPFDELNNINYAEFQLSAINLLSKALNIDSKTLTQIHHKLPEEVISSASMMELDLGDAVEILSQSNARLFDIYLNITSLFKERQELSKKLLDEERMEGTIESLKISLATLSHYINNATSNIQGKCEILHLHYNKNDNYKTLIETIPEFLSSIDNSVRKISLILEELSEISSLESQDFFRHSKAINIEKKIKEKLSSQFEKTQVGQ